MILAIDPGPERSAWLEFRRGYPTKFGIDTNEDVLTVIARSHSMTLAIESIASYGMAVGADVFETAVWSGRFIQRWVDDPASRRLTSPVQRVYRRDVKLYLCGNQRAKDANVRQALIDRYGPGKEAAIGRKVAPGVLYGVKSHIWSALAVAVTAADLERAEATREAA